MSRRTGPPPLTWDRDKLGTERAKIDEHGTIATLAPVPGGYWWQVYWPPKTRRYAEPNVRPAAGLARAARQGNAGGRDEAEAAAFAAYREGRP